MTTNPHNAIVYIHVFHLAVTQHVLLEFNKVELSDQIHVKITEFDFC